jgi:hypothetical protein
MSCDSSTENLEQFLMGTSLHALLLVAAVNSALATANIASFDDSWKFYRGDSTEDGSSCDFPVRMNNMRCMGLTAITSAKTSNACEATCCASSAFPPAFPGPEPRSFAGGCKTWQFCAVGASCSQKGCWIGTHARDCGSNSDGWVGASKEPHPSVCDTDFCRESFDDSAWRTLDVPHDWGIEDLPPRTEDTTAPVLGPRYGTWAFSPGDDASWSKPGFDDSHWQRVQGGQDWRTHSNYTAKNAIGWYRQAKP